MVNRGASLSVPAQFLKLQAVACSFAFTLIACLAVTRYIAVPGLPRYDLIFVLCLALQAVLVWRGFETWPEVRVMAIFHIVGVLLEWNKVHAGAWSYPEPAYLKINGVPLYSGFMYAAVASYMMAAWRLFELRFSGWPSAGWVAATMLLVYGQFFVPVQIFAIRLVTLAFLFGVFGRCRVAFAVNDRHICMPAPVAFTLIGFFVWIAENIATYFHAWSYPYQVPAWQPVHLSKVLSWTMLMVVSLSVIQAHKAVARRLQAARSEA